MKRLKVANISLNRSGVAEIDGCELLSDSDKNHIAEVIAGWILTRMSDPASVIIAPEYTIGKMNIEPND